MSYLKSTTCDDREFIINTNTSTALFTDDGETAVLELREDNSKVLLWSDADGCKVLRDTEPTDHTHETFVALHKKLNS